MALNISEDPWALVQDAVPLVPGSSINVSGQATPRIICKNNANVWYKRRTNFLPKASFPFRWGNEVRQAYCLPTNAKPKDIEELDFTVKIGIDDISIELNQENIVGRFTNDICPENTRSFSVTSWIDWLINSYRELAHEEDLKNSECAFPGLTRREWISIKKQFLEKGSNKAMMSLIVRLASDRVLSSTLESLSNNPRKVLQRVREELPISRIQQMDSACIRDYARRPGANAPEKAGPRQKLLALNRVENTNTLENRVAAWVMEELQLKSKSYMSENSMHSQSMRVRSVRRIGFNSNVWRCSELFQSVRTESLNHPIMPNYPLQLDRKYKKIYKIYQELLKDRKVHDDAWEWQRNLWSSAARSILYSRLTERYEEPFISHSFIRSESYQGQWVETPVAPGPFKIQGDLYYVFDCGDISAKDWLEQREHFPGAHEIGITGCDLVLYSPKTGATLLVWLYYWTGSAKGFFRRQKSCLESMKQVERSVKRTNPKRLKNMNDSQYSKVCNDRKKVNFKGLVLGSLLEEDAKVDMDSYSKESETDLVSVLLPYRSYAEVEDFDIALDLVLGETK